MMWICFHHGLLYRWHRCAAASSACVLRNSRPASAKKTSVVSEQAGPPFTLHEGIQPHTQMHKCTITNKYEHTREACSTNTHKHACHGPHTRGAHRTSQAKVQIAPLPRGIPEHQPRGCAIYSVIYIVYFELPGKNASLQALSVAFIVAPAKAGHEPAGTSHEDAGGHGLDQGDPATEAGSGALEECCALRLGVGRAVDLAKLASQMLKVQHGVSVRKAPIQH